MEDREIELRKTGKTCILLAGLLCLVEAFSLASAAAQPQAAAAAVAATSQAMAGQATNGQASGGQANDGQANNDQASPDQAMNRQAGNGQAANRLLADDQAAAGSSAAQVPLGGSEAAAAPQIAFHARRVRIVWPVVARAVRYEVVLLSGPEDTPDNVVARQDYIYTNGVELDLTPYGDDAAGLYWKVYPLDHDGHAIADSTTPLPIASGTPDPTAPLPTTEFEQMDYAPLYPVFSWIPTLGAKHHIIEVYRERDGEKKVVRTLTGGEYDVYEEGGYTVPGRYDWRVRAVDDAGTPISDWSAFASFDVTAPTPVAALGDSITHGGGAMTVPPGYLIYDWETYSPVPVKNLGYSGNTTAAMLERFERDVLPFSPRVLVIMGGVNDYRGTTYGSETVANLAAIRAKCDAYGIIPVFATVTPINPGLILRYGQIEVPPADWQVHRDYINRWIMEQTYAVDVASALQDANGWLDARYTTDGLHPDDYGKREIGECIGAYLAAHFPWITDHLVKKPVPQALQAAP